MLIRPEFLSSKREKASSKTVKSAEGNVNLTNDGCMLLMTFMILEYNRFIASDKAFKTETLFSSRKIALAMQTVTSKSTKQDHMVSYACDENHFKCLR